LLESRLHELTTALCLHDQADKLRTQQQLEQLQARYVGTGHADTTKFEWSSNIHRDSLASYVGHTPLLSYMAIGLGEPREKVRAMLLEKMVQPAGKPPEVSSTYYYLVSLVIYRAVLAFDGAVGGGDNVADGWLTADD
jgi:splicing factor 3B subunit 5